MFSKYFANVVNAVMCFLCRIVSMACSPSGSSFVCSAAGKLQPMSGGAELSTPRLGKLSVWDLKTMKPEVECSISIKPIKSAKFLQCLVMFSY